MRIIILLSLLLGCGSQESVRVYKKPVASTRPSVSWDEIKPLVDENCNKCHGKSIGQAFTKANYGPKAVARVANGTMPPGGGLSPDVKSKLESYR